MASHTGPILAFTAAGVGAAMMLRRRAAPERLPAWERAALVAGEVGEAEGEHPEPDAPPVGGGTPEAHCRLLAATPDQPDAPAGAYCVADPLGDPRFAPVDRGAPLSSLPSSSTWPVLTEHRSRLVVSYWTEGGAQGYSGRAFGAKRVDTRDGETLPRRHAGVDLFGRAGDVVVAPEDGRVIRVLPFYQGTWAIYLRSALGERVVNLGELAQGSWREFGVKPGQLVLEGQPLARIGLQAKGSMMLHLESYGVADVSDEELVAAIRGGVLRWVDDAPPAWLRDPSAYLITAATRTYRRALVYGDRA